MEVFVTVFLTKESYRPKEPNLWDMYEWLGRPGIIYRIKKWRDEDGEQITYSIKGWRVSKYSW